MSRPRPMRARLLAECGALIVIMARLKGPLMANPSREPTPIALGHLPAVDRLQFEEAAARLGLNMEALLTTDRATLLAEYQDLAEQSAAAGRALAAHRALLRLQRYWGAAPTVGDAVRAAGIPAAALPADLDTVTDAEVLEVERAVTVALAVARSIRRPLGQKRRRRAQLAAQAHPAAVALSERLHRISPDAADVLVARTLDRVTAVAIPCLVTQLLARGEWPADEQAAVEHSGRLFQDTLLQLVLDGHGWAAEVLTAVVYQEIMAFTQAVLDEEVAAGRLREERDADGEIVYTRVDG